MKIPEWRLKQLDLWIEQYAGVDESKFNQMHLDSIEKENINTIESGNCMLVENDDGKQLIIRRDQIQE